jgi:hypothetical protein
MSLTSGTRPPLMSAASLLSVAAMSKVPPNFGGRDGPTIVNKDTVLNQVDAALTFNRPPGPLTAARAQHASPSPGAAVASALHYSRCSSSPPRRRTAQPHPSLQHTALAHPHADLRWPPRTQTSRCS